MWGIITNTFRQIFKIPVGKNIKIQEKTGTLLVNNKKMLAFSKSFWFPSPDYGLEHRERIEKILEKI